MTDLSNTNLNTNLNSNLNTNLNLEIEMRAKEAVVPSKAHDSDVGYDLVCISLHKINNTGEYLFDTGLAVKPPEGYYIEIVPRSSISKTGWMLANSIGIIDPNYRGNLFVALRPVNDSRIQLNPPFCLSQMILRKLPDPVNIMVVDKLDQTDRGSGGFGSSGSRV